MMGRGRKGSGVEPRDSGYRIRFTWNGERYAVTLDLTPSAAHAKHAARVARDVKRAIDEGTFSFARFFPDSKHAKIAAPKRETWGQRCDAWLATRKGPELAKSTKGKDVQYARFWKKLFGAATPMESMTPTKVEGEVASYEWPSAKHRNNLLVALRGICDLWVKDDRRNRVSPAGDIVNATVTWPDPDPFEAREAVAIVDSMTERYDARIPAYYEFAFFAGMRPEEQIALRWTKIDDATRTARVDVARTAGAEKDTKNHVARTVHLNPRAWAALERMRAATFMKEHGHVFENPRTGKPWASEADQRDLYWTPTLKKLRMRHRRAYETRSTCATMYLMMGRKPGWIAKELGHSERVFWQHYARWIERADRARELETFDDDFAALTETNSALFRPKASRERS